MHDINVDLNVIRESNPDITVGELVRDYIVPEFSRGFGEAMYKEFPYGSYGNKPYIIIPCGDGKIKNDDYNPYILIDTLVEGKVSESTSTTYIRVGMIHTTSGYKKEISSIGFSVFSEGSSAGNTNTTINLANYGAISAKILNIDSTSYHFGVYGGTIPTIGSMNVIISKTKSVIDESENDAVFVMPYGTNVEYIAEVYTYNGSIYQDSICQWELPKQSTIANMYQFNNGYVYKDDLFLCFPMRHTILRQLIYLNNTVSSSMWSKSIVIGGKKFTLHINAGNGESGSCYITLARIV